MAFGFLHNTQSSGASITSLVITIPAVPVGTLLVINVKTTITVTSITATDNASTPNTYALATQSNNGSNDMYQLYGVAVTGGATTVTVSWTGVTSTRITVDQFSGGMRTNATVFDKAANTSGLTGTSSSISLSPTNAGELVSSGLSLSNGTSVVAGTGYILSNNNTSCATEYKASSTTSESVAYTWTTTSASAQVAGAYIPLSGVGNFMELF